MSGWRRNVRHIQTGEPVSAGVAGRPDRALEQRTAHLKEVLDASALGAAIFDVDATLDPTVLEGQPVFWNAETQRYEAALAGVEPDAESSVLVPTAASDCDGLLYVKRSAALGDVVLYGLVKLPSLTNAIGDTIAAGRYYLSSSEAGKLVAQRPPVSVSVCKVLGAKETCDDDPWVIVGPQMRDFLEDHIHYSFELECVPSGTHTPPLTEDDRHEISDADVTIKGWLPADHASFGGNAPARAAFGYNLAAHPELEQVWPPIPLSAVSVFWDKGQNRAGAALVPAGLAGLVVCDAHGIWWMSDCYGDVPWPTAYDNTVSSSSSESSLSSDAPPECPRDETMRIVVAYAQMVYATDRSVVTSLAPAEGSPIVVTNCDGEVALTGALELGFDLNTAIETETELGSSVVKEITDEFKIKRGKVLEGLIPGSESVTLTSETTRLEDPDDEDSETVYQGVVTIDVNLEPVDRELAPQIVRLSDAVERLYKDTPYIGLPEGRDSSVRLRINIPPTGLPTSPEMTVRVVLFGRVTATLPELTMSYARITRPDGGAIALPTSDTSLTFDAAEAVTLDEAIEVESAAFEVAAGDTVLVTIARDVDAGYAGEVGLIRIGGIIAGG